MVKLEVNSNRLVSGKGISIPAPASLKFLFAVTETILARGYGRREVRQTRGSYAHAGKCSTRVPIGPEAETRASARGSRVASGDDRSELALTLTPPRDSSLNPKGVTYVLNEYTGLTGATPPRKIGKQTS